MLSFKVRLFGGAEKAMPSPLTVVYNSEDGVPADDLTVTFPYSGNFVDKTDFIYAFDGDELVFAGQADEIVTSKSGGGAVVRLTARSMAAFLLDNEAEPCVYYNIAPSQIYQRHLMPYGFENTVTADEPFFGVLKVTKGMSEWQVLDNFCRNKYGNNARITGGGRVIFKKEADESRLCFSDSGENCYFSLKKSINRYKVISEVRLMLTEENRYSSRLINESADSGIIRRRFVNATTDTSTVSTADKMIKRSNNEAFEIVLECAGRYLDITGRSAEIRDSRFGKTEGLYVHSLKYSLSGGGEKTVITMRKEG